MRIDWDVPIPMDDGIVLRADVYRPLGAGRVPAILSYGPYGKGLVFEDLYTDQWRLMVEAYPEVMAELDQQVPELGGRGPREVGAGRLRVRPGGLPRRRPLAGRPRHLVARGRRGTSTTASSGRRLSPGAAARSA